MTDATPPPGLAELRAALYRELDLREQAHKDGTFLVFETAESKRLTELQAKLQQQDMVLGEVVELLHLERGS